MHTTAWIRVTPILLNVCTLVLIVMAIQIPFAMQISIQILATINQDVLVIFYGGVSEIANVIIPERTNCTLKVSKELTSFVQSNAMVVCHTVMKQHLLLWAVIQEIALKMLREFTT